MVTNNFYGNNNQVIIYNVVNVQQPPPQLPEKKPPLQFWSKFLNFIKHIGQLLIWLLKVTPLLLAACALM